MVRNGTSCERGCGAPSPTTSRGCSRSSARVGTAKSTCSIPTRKPRSLIREEQRQFAREPQTARSLGRLRSSFPFVQSTLGLRPPSPRGGGPGTTVVAPGRCCRCARQASAQRPRGAGHPQPSIRQVYVGRCPASPQSAIRRNGRLHAGSPTAVSPVPLSSGPTFVRRPTDPSVLGVCSRAV